MTQKPPCEIDDFSAALLQVLMNEAMNQTDQAEGAPQARPAGVSVSRLGKALGVSASVVMRQLTLLGDVCGMGWVTVAPDGDRFMVQLTEAGRQAGCMALQTNPDARQS